MADDQVSPTHCLRCGAMLNVDPNDARDRRCPRCNTPHVCQDLAPDKFPMTLTLYSGKTGEAVWSMTKILDSTGTLQLIDTGRRCSVRDVRILCVHCTAGCGDDLLHDGIVDPYWSTVKMLSGYHQGCDPDSAWSKDPVGSKLQHDAMKSLLDRRPSGACIACNQLDCTGADTPTRGGPEGRGDPS